ncbi:MAG TPA: FtsQ-type POTRA domain-containing protein [Dehalococcoidia bacterium]
MPKRGPSFRQRRGQGVPKALRGEMLLDDYDQRQLRRRKERRMIGIGVLICLVAAVIGLYISPILRVQHVEVTGTSALNPEDVATLADIHGNSMVSSSFAGAEARVAALPQVRSVQIQRHWPDTIKIAVTERAPWATWTAGATPYTIDETGVVLATTAADAGPIIHAPASAALLQPGDHVDADALALTHSLVEQVPTQLGVNLTEIDWSTNSGVTVTTDVGYKVVFGDSANMQYKLAVWQGVETEFGRDSMAGHVLDLRFGERPSFQ